MFYGEKRSSTYSLCGLGYRTTLVKGQSSHLQKRDKQHGPHRAIRLNDLKSHSIWHRISTQYKIPKWSRIGGGVTQALALNKPLSEFRLYCLAVSVAVCRLSKHFSSCSDLVSTSEICDYYYLPCRAVISINKDLIH